MLSKLLTTTSLIHEIHLRSSWSALLVAWRCTVQKFGLIDRDKFNRRERQRQRNPFKAHCLVIRTVLRCLILLAVLFSFPFFRSLTNHSNRIPTLLNIKWIWLFELNRKNRAFDTFDSFSRLPVSTFNKCYYTGLTQFIHHTMKMRKSHLHWLTITVNILLQYPIPMSSCSSIQLSFQQFDRIKYNEIHQLAIFDQSLQRYKTRSSNY